MSTREPLWFCHECHAEMRPLMVPDPTCASCHGSFVEKMENPADDPRDFAHEGVVIGPEPAELPPGADNFFMGLQGLLERGMRPNPTQTSSSFTFEVTDRNGLRTIQLGGGPNPMHEDQRNRPGTPNSVPNMSTFVNSNIPPGQGRPTIPGALLAQYLMSMLGNHDHAMFGMPENGRMGDYVFNQEALDQIITQLMENSNASRPVPATEETIHNLDRDVLTASSPNLQKDCAVCKEQFKLETEDPDELVIVTLPCKHPFHEPCILPWLRSSGTCPVCRYALIPQPEHNPTPPLRPNTGPDIGGTSNHRRNSGPGSPGTGGLFHSFFSGFHGPEGHSPSNASRGPNNDPRPSGQRTRSPQHQRSHGSSRRNTGRDHFPGGWSEELD